ncbi:hypothetical protein [Thermoactinomyces mirandus]|uniref:Uncharacterized protein n=1 Tax=Thermoactinomyces mirandus TaxID=2756294 RepID=A0A7W1XQ59_9BACL|nr:hypothetical protein [Thermoactinomyces mirandus]MBA4601228.1 hypothetical protein [Thermoactinomyces mirandus]
MELWEKIGVVSAEQMEMGKKSLAVWGSYIYFSNYHRWISYSSCFCHIILYQFLCSTPLSRYYRYLS